MLKRAGFDQIVIDGRADRPVRLEVVDGACRIVDAEDELFETVAGRRVPRAASVITDTLTAAAQGIVHPDRRPGRLEPGRFRLPHRRPPPQLRPRRRGRRLRLEEPRRHHRARQRSRQLRRPGGVPAPRAGSSTARSRRASTTRPGRPRSARRRARPGGSTAPSTAATSASRAAICPGTISTRAPSTPADYDKVSTDAFLAISGKHNVCNKCRHVFCTRGGPGRDRSLRGRRRPAGVRDDRPVDQLLHPRPRRHLPHERSLQRARRRHDDLRQRHGRGHGAGREGPARPRPGRARSSATRRA